MAGKLGKNVVCDTPEELHAAIQQYRSEYEDKSPVIMFALTTDNIDALDDDKSIVADLGNIVLVLCKYTTTGTIWQVMKTINDVT